MNAFDKEIERQNQQARETRARNRAIKRGAYKQPGPNKTSKPSGFFQEEKKSPSRQKKKQKVVISDQCKRIVHRLTTERNWPKGSEEQLPEAVQRSLNSYTNGFYKKFTKLKKTLPSLPGYPKFLKSSQQSSRFLVNFVAWLDSMHQMNPEGFIWSWFMEVNDHVSSWAKWDGNLLRYKFSTSSRKWEMKGRELAHAYNSPDYWDRLLDAMENLE